MAGSVNRVTLIGRLGKDPESKAFQGGGAVVTFPLATSEQWNDRQSGERKEKVEWHQISIWNEALGEVASKYLKKGSQVYLEGKLETRSWDKDGQTHYATEVVLRPFNSDLQMLGSAPDRPVDAKPRAAHREPGGRS